MNLSFGNGGVVDLPATVPNPWTTVAAVALPGRKSLTVSNSPIGDGDYLLSRFNADGSPDASFGQDGAVTIHPFKSFPPDGNWAADCSIAEALAVDGSGRIYVAATGFNADSVVDRFNPDGSIDTSYGEAGAADLNADQSNSMLQTVTSLALSPDGSVFAGGYVLRHSHRHQALRVLAVEEVNAGGELSTRFGAGGVAQAEFYQRGRFLNSTADALTSDAFGNVVAAGGGSGWYDVVRFTPAGLRDAGFGSHGEVRFRGDGGDDTLKSVALRADGELLVGGGAARENTTHVGGGLIVAAIRPNGRLDQTFGTAGAVSVAAGTDANGHARDARVAGLAVTPTGKLLVAGNVFSDLAGDDNGIVLAQLNADGSADTSFGNDANGTLAEVPGGQAPAGWGFVPTPAVYAPGDQAVGLAQAGAGRFFIPFAGGLGRAFEPQATELFFNPDGLLNRNFGADGVAITGAGAAAFTTSVSALAASGSGDVVTRSSINEKNLSDLYSIDPRGTLTLAAEDTSANGDYLGEFPRREPVAMQPDGKVLFQLHLNDGTVELYRLNTDGSMDGSFGNDGVVPFNQSPVEFEQLTVSVGADGTILVSLYRHYGGLYGTNVNTLFVLDATGTVIASAPVPDATLTFFGQAASTFAGGAVTDDGKVVEAVLATSLNAQKILNGYTATRLNADLTVDTSFGTSGSTALPTGSSTDSIKVQPGARLLFGGVGITALTPGGSIDASFGQNGTLSTPSALSDTNWAVQDDGGILVAYVVRGVLRVERFTADGTLDPGFGDAGTATFYVHGSRDSASPDVAIQQTADGQLLLVSGQVQASKTNGGTMTPYVIAIAL